VKRLVAAYGGVQLATLVDAPPSGENWLHEVKFDGYRLLGFVEEREVLLLTRSGKDWTSAFPPLVHALSGLKVKDAVLDMEAVVLDAEGKSHFQDLQAALGEGGDSSKIVAYAFDLLHLNGESLVGLPLLQRKEKLRGILRGKTLRYSEHVLGQGDEMFASACAKGLEGIVSKVADAPYVAGRQKSWLKSKCGQRQEFIILGYSRARSGDRALGALYLGYRQESALRYAGKVGTGFSMQSALELTERFRPIVIAEPTLTRLEMGKLPAREWSEIQWLRPTLLCEVAFTEWTNDGRIRHPSFQGLRDDKDATEVTQEVAQEPKMPTKSVGAMVIAGITITHPERVISETGHVTKGEVAEYYGAVAEWMLPGLVRRPISLLRCPSGIDSECFFQRNPGRGLGKDVHPFEFHNKGKRYEYLYIEDEKGLLEVAQMGAIELHPWGASIDAIDYPERLVFDLDPAPDVPFEALKLGAEDLRQTLLAQGLESTLKCTGGKGLHVTVHLEGKDKWPVAKAFAASVAEEMVAAVPDAYVATMSKEKRHGRIFIDYFRNDYTATSIADYSVRARPGAPVAVPLEWKELKMLKAADQFTMKDVLARVKRRKNDGVQKKYRIPSA
jgi:bifunctional non-homologous end joining protein LigD